VSKRKAFRYFTIVLFLVCGWTIFANVLSDDAAVRAMAEEAARSKAGCGSKCKVTGIHGSRGMIDETITYDMDPQGQWTSTCRRAFFVVGDYTCTAEKP
jgi:hypothetical protein